MDKTDSPRVWIAPLVSAGLLVAGCGAQESSENVSVVPAAATADQPGEQLTSPSTTGTMPSLDRPLGEMSEDEVNGVLEGYEASDQMPVADSGGEIVGYASYELLMGPDGDPAIADVRSYETGDLIGYRIRYVGYVPVEQIEPDTPLDQVVTDMYGEEQLAAIQRNAEVSEFINSFPPGELWAAVQEFLDN